MEGHLRMSMKERGRLEWLPRVKRGELSLSAAAEGMGLCYRQAQRVMKRYLGEQDAGLVHRARGRPSPRAIKPACREQILQLCKERYRGLGPTLAAEYLADREGITLSPETIRRWWIEAGDWQPREPKARHRTWRKRKAHFGEMVQLDGSVHDWFEGRAASCFAMNMVDDATGTKLCLFAEEETTRAAMDVLAGWITLHGIPRSLYVDARSVYVTKREPTIEEQLSGDQPLTQFGQACKKLGIEIVVAHSPQAKGRIERTNGVLQDRLIKAMRIDAVSGIEAANAYLPGWLPQHNRRFAISARDPRDMHRRVPQDLDLRSVFCLEVGRTIANDWTVRYDNQWLQIHRQPDLPPARSRVRVQRWQDGSIHILHRGRELASHQTERPTPAARRMQVSKAKTAPVPQSVIEDHSWRTGRFLPTDTRPLKEQFEDLADTYLGPVRIAGLELDPAALRGGL